MVLVFLKWRGNVPSGISVMKLGLTVLAVVLAASLSSPAQAQIVKPIDPNKKADVSDKTLNYDNVSFDTLSQPTSVLPSSPLSKGGLKFQDVDHKKVDLKTLEMSTVSTPSLPRSNFTAKRAEVDVLRDETKKQADQTKKQTDQTKKKAQINERQIRPFTPPGEEELKHQLNQPPLEAH
jgi:hypothetical protein